jgi:hypothetical protein
VSELEEGIGAARSVLDSLGVPFALVGGFAVSVHTEPRFTRDVDLVVAVADDEQAELIVQAMVERGATAFGLVEQDATGRLATARLRLHNGHLLDLLFASSGVEREIVEAAAPTEVLPGLTVPVAGVGDLLALKLLARDDVNRPNDAADLRALQGVASSVDIERARGLLELIDTRGYARGRDLRAALEELIADL